MIASVYIKDGNIHFYNEGNSFSSLGGFAYELGRPLLDFVCYEPERFDDAFSIIASALDYPLAYLGINEPEFRDEIKRAMTEAQQHEIYVYFYQQLYTEFIYDFVESPRRAITKLEEKIPGAIDKLCWAMDLEWPVSQSPYIQVISYQDNEQRLFRAAMDVVSLLSADVRKKQASMINEIELLLSFREVIGTPETSSTEYLYWIDEYRRENTGYVFYLENPLRSFYGVVKPPEVVQLYEIDTLDDLFRFEFIKMIENDIFIKKCKNCERFFIPRRRADAEYCERIYGDANRKCSEIGATLRYERKVAENPILEAHKKAYRRFHSRVRTKKMTQSEFMAWSDEAAKKRDACLAGQIPFEGFVAWLEQGRVRKIRVGRVSDRSDEKSGI